MFHRSLRSIILTLFCFILLSISGIAVIYRWGGSLGAARLQAAAVTTEPRTFDDPLPPGCIGGTPAGEEQPVCCISGFVFVEGQPMLNAEVIIDTASGAVITTTTTYQAGLEPNPYYTVDLSSFRIAPGEFITLTARYSGIDSTPRQYQVQSGGQRLDLLIYDSDVLAVGGQVNESPAVGKFRIPRDIASDSQGNLYVIDHLGFRVQVFSQSGAILARPHWQKTQGNNVDQWAEPYGIAIDKRTDTVYISDIANQRITLYDSDGQRKAIWDQTELQTNFFGAPADVAVDSTGNVLVLSSQIYKYNQDGAYLGRWGNFVDPKQLAIAPSGEVYVTTYGTTPVYRFSSTGEPLPFSPTTAILFPFGIAVDSANKVYLADLPANGNVGAPRISALRAEGQLLQQWNYPTANETLLNGALGMTIEGNTLYIADQTKHRVARVDTQGNFLAPWGSVDDSAQQLYQPHDLALLHTGPLQDHLFVADASIALIITDTLVNRWTYTDTGKEANWTPWKLTVDPQGQLWVMDPGFPRDLTRYTVSADGRQLVRNGGPWKGTIGATSVFSGYVDLAVDSQGYIYMADERNNRLVIYREESPTTLTKVTEFMSASTLTPPTLLNPQGIAIDENDPAYPNAVVVYLADTGNNRLVKLAFANQQISPIVAWQTLPATTACSRQSTTALRQPYGLVVDPGHNLYVADRGNSRVIKVDSTTGQCLAAYGGKGYGDGLFQLPEGVALDSKGRLYVSDWTYSRVQHFVPMAVSAPIATIVHLSSVELHPGDRLTVTGAGQDGDVTNQIVAYQWSSDRGLTLTTTSPIFAIPTTAGPTTANTLGAGVHRLQLRVQDNEGEWSAPVTVLIFVEHRRPQPPLTPTPMPDPVQPPPPPPTSCPAGGLWTFLLYLDADYNDNESLFGAYLQSRSDLATVDHACVQFFVQVDGYKTTAHRYSKRFGGEMEEVSGFTPAELAMDASETLGDFIAAGQQQLPADHYYLAIADHGDGMRGLAWDHTTAADGSAYLTAAEVRQALNRTDVLPVDILHLDACSMALLDFAYQVRNKVKFLIASQYLGWNFFAYADYARYAGSYPQPADLAYQVVQRYGELAKSRQLPATLAALNLARIEPVRNGVDELAARLGAWLNNDDTNRTRHAKITTLREQSQFFDSNSTFTNSPIDYYIDLLDWLSRLHAAALNPEITALAQKLINELQRADADRVIWTSRIQSGQLPAKYADGAAINLSGAHGLSIYYPLEGQPRLQALHNAANSSTAVHGASQVVAYTQIYADYLGHKSFDFTRVSRWDEFLQAAYGTPSAGTPLDAPLPPSAPLDGTDDFVYLPLVMR